MSDQDKASEQRVGTSISFPGEELDEAVAKVLEASLGRAAGGLGDTVATVWGGLIGDQLNEWRTRNFVNGLEKTAQFLKAKGINLSDCRALPNGEMYSIFEGMSKQDDPDLQELWASLLANSMNPNGTGFRREFIVILDSLEPSDARFLTFIGKVEKFEKSNEYPRPNVPIKIFEGDLTEAESENLKRWEEYNERLRSGYNNIFDEMKLEDIDCEEACGRLIRHKLLEYDEKLKTHYWSTKDYSDELPKDIEKLAKYTLASHTGEISGSIFNMMMAGTKNPNYSLTNLGKEIAAACIPEYI